MWNLGLKIVAGGVVVAGLIWLVSYFWQRPEKWNGTASGYLDRANRLGLDSTNWVVERGILNGKIVHRDSIITKLADEARRAQDYAQQWEGKFNSAIALKDATIDRLTDSERELAYFKALQKNGTLAPIAQGEVLTLSSPKVVTAGLKTASREEAYRLSSEALNNAAASIMARNDRLGARLESVRNRVVTVTDSIDQKMKGGIPIIRHKRRKQLKEVKRQLLEIKRGLDQESDLERILKDPNVKL